MSLSLTKPGKLMPALTAIIGAEEGRVFNASIKHIWIRQRRFQVPDSCEFPGVLGAIVVLVSARVALVEKFVADCLPGPTTVFRTLNDLSEPTGGLRNVQSICVDRGASHVVDLPATEVWTINLPILPALIRREDECTLLSANK
jgi:hypothetical protein